MQDRLCAFKDKIGDKVHRRRTRNIYKHNPKIFDFSKFSERLTTLKNIYNDPNKRIRKRNRNKTTNDLIVTSGSVPESIEQLGDVVKRIEDLKTFDEKDEERENPQTISIDLPDPPELELFSTEYAVNAAILPSLDEFNPETNGFQSIFNDLERSAYGPTSSQFDNYGSFDSNGSFGNQQGFQYEMQMVLLSFRNLASNIITGFFEKSYKVW
ncbi:Protein CBG27627 [Caenorhabditis briggsae]|uniref:Protein CBG27627 n=1 Tax=Caenorhabditis briggsae TaxID=6238 RepID=B6IJ72_CAEBR|nr:Protein CBG27627 [Caenorhabditis briggsae]CAR99906.1 Protein CBG27627 [Caenorhabditis briggsae]